MKINNILSLATAAALTFASSGAFAVATIGAGTNSGAAGATVTIPVTYNRPAGDANNVFSATFRFAHTNPPITFVSFSSVGATPPASSATTCNANGANTLVTCVLTTNPPTGIAVGNYTLGTITYQIGAGATPGAQSLVATVVECTDINGDAIANACSPSNGTITVTGGVVNTPPTIGYNPATSSVITYAGAGTAAPIVATPSGGAGSGAAATTTVGACTISAGGAAFPTTNIAQLSFVGATVTPQNIVLPNCVPQAAQVDATLTCPESLGGAAATNRTWTLRCPAAAVGAVPPTLTYNPAPGSSNNVAAGNALTIGVGCPTDGSACTGSGTGLAATARLENLTATYAGPMFSPIPAMACAFVTEGGTPTGGNTLDFVAQAADPGDIRCTCPVNTTSLPTEPFTVSVLERSPASGGTTVARSFTIVCGAPPPVCGTATFIASAPGATINLTNGGAAAQVSSVSLVGASNGVNQTISCATSNVSAGSTFTVTTTPTPLVISTNPALGGTINAGCTNTAETTGTATLTCTGTSATAGCSSTTTFTLSCPGQAAPPPPGEFVPVPALNEQGRILLAALVLLLGLGVVGFRMRG